LAVIFCTKGPSTPTLDCSRLARMKHPERDNPLRESLICPESRGLHPLGALARTKMGDRMSRKRIKCGRAPCEIRLRSRLARARGLLSGINIRDTRRTGISKQAGRLRKAFQPRPSGQQPPGRVCLARPKSGVPPRPTRGWDSASPDQHPIKGSAPD